MDQVPNRTSSDHIFSKTRFGLLNSFALWLLAGVVLAVDQGTKYIVVSLMYPGQSVPTEGIARITYVTNHGSAFGFLPGQSLILIVGSFVAIGILVLFYRFQSIPSALMRLSLGLQLGGAAGNLIDRIRQGYVVDFLDLGWWPVFNVADSAIVSGIVILVGYILFFQKRHLSESKPGSEEAVPYEQTPTEVG